MPLRSERLNSLNLRMMNQAWMPGMLLASPMHISRIESAGRRRRLKRPGIYTVAPCRETVTAGAAKP